MGKHDHPWWVSILRTSIICGTLLGLQLITATSWDAQIDGEAGVVGGVALVSLLNEWLRRGP